MCGGGASCESAAPARAPLGERCLAALGERCLAGLGERCLAALSERCLVHVHQTPPGILHGFQCIIKFS